MKSRPPAAPRSYFSRTACGCAERLGQTVAEEREREHRHRDRRARDVHQMRRRLMKDWRSTASSPTWRGWLHAEAEEAEAGLDGDRDAEEDGDLHDHRRRSRSGGRGARCDGSCTRTHTTPRCRSPPARPRSTRGQPGRTAARTRCRPRHRVSEAGAEDGDHGDRHQEPGSAIITSTTRPTRSRTDRRVTGDHPEPAPIQHRSPPPRTAATSETRAP